MDPYLQAQVLDEVRTWDGAFQPDPDVAALVRPEFDGSITLRVIERWGPRTAAVWESMGRPKVFYGDLFAADDEDYAWLPDSGVTDLQIVGWLPKDLSSFQAATQLESLLLGPCKGRLHCSRLTNLRALSTGFPITGFEQLSELAVLHLDGWKDSDLTRLEAMVGLETLSVSGRLTSLRGLAGLPCLRRLALRRTRGIESLSGLEGSTALEELDIHSASNLRDISAVAAVPSMRDLRLDCCMRLETLGPVRGHPGLAWIGLLGSTVVGDGDLSPVLDIPTLTFFGAERTKGYRPSEDEVRAELARRHGPAPEPLVQAYTVETQTYTDADGNEVTRSVIRLTYEE